jgi:hypothetical protein
MREGFEAWLLGRGGQHSHFRGDLDWSAMRILAAMRASFPELSGWQPGYVPMLEALRDGRGHSPAAAEKAGGSGRRRHRAAASPIASLSRRSMRPDGFSTTSRSRFSKVVPHDLLSFQIRGQRDPSLC